jgi:hypothetical protein
LSEFEREPHGSRLQVNCQVAEKSEHADLAGWFPVWLRPQMDRKFGSGGRFPTQMLFCKYIKYLIYRYLAGSLNQAVKPSDVTFFFSIAAICQRGPIVRLRSPANLSIPI